MEKLFQLLTEHDETLVLKTLGLIRNLISSRAHIDLIMTTSGTKIIQAVVMILESDYYNVNVKEQALCILSNVADGQSSKEFIMDNEDLLRKINSFMVNYLSWFFYILAFYFQKKTHTHIFLVNRILVSFLFYLVIF